MSNILGVLVALTAEAAEKHGVAPENNVFMLSAHRNNLCLELTDIAGASFEARAEDVNVIPYIDTDAETFKAEIERLRRGGNIVEPPLAKQMYNVSEYLEAQLDKGDEDTKRYFELLIFEAVNGADFNVIARHLCANLINIANKSLM